MLPSAAFPPLRVRQNPFSRPTPSVESLTTPDVVDALRSPYRCKSQTRCPSEARFALPFDLCPCYAKSLTPRPVAPVHNRARYCPSSSCCSVGRLGAVRVGLFESGPTRKVGRVAQLRVERRSKARVGTERP